MDLLDQDTDSLDSLEERILKTVQLVNRLRQEKEAARKEAETILAEKQAAVKAAAEAAARAEALSEELESLRTERKLVRVRIEKLLGHIDQLSSA